MSYEVVDFEKDVINQSKKVAVVVDFWAPWCGPCRILGPVIEHLTEQANGKWKLVKVNTDENQSEASRFQVRGIPAVKMFVDGNVKAEFTGALPEHQIKKWLEENLSAPAAEQEVMAQIVLLKQSEKHNQARELASKAVEKYPDNKEIRYVLFRMLLPKFIERAQNVFLPLADDPDFMADKESLDVFTYLRERFTSNEYKEGNEKVVELFKTGVTHLFNESLETALDAFITVIGIDKSYDNEMARKAVVALFRLLGEEHPLTKSKQRAFSMALY